MQLSLEDLDTLTENRALCNDDGELDLASFERLIRYQLQAHLSFPLPAHRHLFYPLSAILALASAGSHSILEICAQTYAPLGRSRLQT